MGVFMAASELRDDVHTSEDDRKVIQSVIEWFNEHLPEPQRLSRSTRSHAHNKAISWFRSTSVMHIDRMSSLVSVLKQYRYPVQIIRSTRPGYIVYEDEFQIVAEPFKGDYRRFLRRT
jgi:hypothetical protein